MTLFDRVYTDSDNILIRFIDTIQFGFQAEHNSILYTCPKHHVFNTQVLKLKSRYYHVQGVPAGIVKRGIPTSFQSTIFLQPFLPNVI